MHACMHAYIHTYLHDFILSRIYRVAKKLISSRKEKERKILITNNKITSLSTNHISINAKCYERTNSQGCPIVQIFFKTT